MAPCLENVSDNSLSSAVSRVSLGGSKAASPAKVAEEKKVEKKVATEKKKKKAVVVAEVKAAKVDKKVEIAEKKVEIADKKVEIVEKKTEPVEKKKQKEPAVGDKKVVTIAEPTPKKVEDKSSSGESAVSKFRRAPNTPKPVWGKKEFCYFCEKPDKKFCPKKGKKHEHCTLCDEPDEEFCNETGEPHTIYCKKVLVTLDRKNLEPAKDAAPAHLTQSARKRRRDADGFAVPDAKIPRRMDSVEVSFDFDSRDSGVPVREPLYVAQSPLRRPNAPRTRSAGPPSRAGLGGIVPQSPLKPSPTGMAGAAAPGAGSSAVFGAHLKPKAGILKVDQFKSPARGLIPPSPLRRVPQSPNVGKSPGPRKRTSFASSSGIEQSPYAKYGRSNADREKDFKDPRKWAQMQVTATLPKLDFPKKK